MKALLLVGTPVHLVRSGIGTETTSGLRSASVVAEQKSTGLLATHTDALKTHSSQSFPTELLEGKGTSNEHF